MKHENENGRTFVKSPLPHNLRIKVSESVGNGIPIGSEDWESKLGFQSQEGGAIPSIRSLETRFWLYKSICCFTCSMIRFFRSKIWKNSFSPVVIFFTSDSSSSMHSGCCCVMCTFDLSEGDRISTVGWRCRSHFH